MLEREQSDLDVHRRGRRDPARHPRGKDAVTRDALAFVRFPDGVDWDGKTVTVCVGIAAAGDGHVGILSQLAEILLDPDRAEPLREANDPDEVLTSSLQTRRRRRDEGRPLPRPR